MTKLAHARLLATVLVGVGTSVGLCACGEPDAGSGASPDGVETVQSALMITNGGAPGHALEYFPCATEGGTCLTAPLTYVAYGANGSFVFKTTSVSGAPTPCNNSTFGGDPMPGVVKACYRSNYQFLTSQNALTYGSGGVEVAYGAYGRFNFASVYGSFTCNDDTFGDPVPGYAKSCYIALRLYNAVAVEGGTIAGLDNTPIAYGANGRFLFRVESGVFPCTVQAWGWDPAYGYNKVCYRFLPPITDEPNIFFDYGGYAWYGSGLNGNYLNKEVDGPNFVACTYTNFGGDPDYGHVKHCYGIGTTDF